MSQENLFKLVLWSMVVFVFAVVVLSVFNSIFNGISWSTLMSTLIGN